MKKKLITIVSVLCLLLTVVACDKQKGEYDLSKEDLSKYMTLGEYKDLTINYNLDEVTDELVHKQLVSYIINAADKIKTTEGTAEDGSIVNVDYIGYMDGVAFDGGAA